METLTLTDFTHLKLAVQAEYEGRRNDFIAALNERASIEDILQSWQYKEYFTPVTIRKNWPSIKEVMEYIISRYDKFTAKKIASKFAGIDLIAKASDLTSIKISVEWSKSRMWGNNPKAEAWYTTTGSSDYIQGSSIGGCGYDKLSTAVAEVLNQILPLKKALYQLKAMNTETNNRELFGYGSGYGVLPSFEGGVGVSCYNRIFNKIGFEFKNIAWGKTYDVYEVSRLTKDSQTED